MEWNNDIEGQLKKQLGDNLEKAAMHLKRRCKEAVNRSQPKDRSSGDKGVWYKGLDPSAPGEAPKKITGFLQRSIAHDMNADRTVAYVGSNLDYAYYLELGTKYMAARPWLRSTLLTEGETLARIIATGRA